MKKAFGLIALALVFVACNKEMGIQPAEQTGDNMITITAQLAPKTAGTKAVAPGDGKIVVTWAENETLRIISANGHEATATITGVTDGSATISFDINAAAVGQNCTIIYPADAAVTESAGVYTASPIAAQDGTLKAALDVRIGAGTIEDATATLDVTIQPAAQFSIFKFYVRGSDGTTAISTKPLTITIGTQEYVITPATATDVLYAALPAASAQKVCFDAKDGSNKTYTCTKLNTSFSAGNYYQSTLKMREYVLMGEGYGLKWATFNIGAENPWDYGGYYAWGETATKDSYNWGNYAFMRAGSTWENITKYTFADGQKSGIWYDGNTFKGDNGDGVEHKDFASYDYADDAARQLWGGSWRIPTEDEWTALRDNTKFTWAWTDDYKGSGVKGEVVISSVTGKEIFLPAAGYRFNAALNFAGTYGYYWSSSLYENYSYDARYVYFHSGGVYLNCDARCSGQSLRPVSE